MPADNQHSILFNEFSAGWCPSDDAINGRKNALLKMDGCTLDDNGSLILAQGTKKVEGPYAADAHSLFIKQMCGERRVYVGLKDGSVWRNDVNLIAPGDGSTVRAAFGVYGDFVLVVSGEKKIKDSCTESSLLGLSPPTEPPLINLFSNVPLEDLDFIGHYSNYVATTGSVAVVDDKLQITVSNDVIVNKTAFIINTSVQDFPKDLSGKEDDTFQFSLKTIDFTRILALSLRFILKLEDGFTTEAYEFVWLKDRDFDVVEFGDDGIQIFKIKRSQFTRTGSDNAFTWANIIGVAIGISGASSANGSYYSTDVVADLFGFKLYRVGEDGNLNGTYQWCQVNVFKSGNYIAMSVPGPVTDEYTLQNGYAEVIPQDPTLIEPQTTEVWIFRRGGTLDQFYRVGVILYDELGPLYDNMSDLDALALNITLNTGVLTLGADLPPEDILEIVGPIFGRMVYFTKTSIYFSEINNPESYNPKNTMLLVSDEAEKFQWARKVSENTIMIGTLKDVYLLTGTFTSFPDGALDVYLRALGVNKPPMSRFVTIYNRSAIYFASQEWIALSPDGAYVNLVSPNTDILYTGQTRHGYGGVPTYIDHPEDVYYPCIVAKNKLWVGVPVIADYTTPTDISLWVYRMEVFDFARKYWRPLSYSPRLLATADDEGLYGFFHETKTVNYMDSPFTKLLNSST